MYWLVPGTDSSLIYILTVVVNENNDKNKNNNNSNSNIIKQITVIINNTI